MKITFNWAMSGLDGHLCVAFEDDLFLKTYSYVRYNMYGRRGEQDQGIQYKGQFTICE